MNRILMLKNRYNSKILGMLNCLFLEIKRKRKKDQR